MSRGAFSLAPATLAVMSQGSGPAVPYAPPPEDWRLPATVTTSAGLSGDQAALAAASSAADAKSRPAVIVTDGATDWIEWTVAETGEALLSFIPRSTSGTFTVTLDGVDQSFAKAIPEGTSEQDRRQAQVMSVTAGQVIRLTIAASGASCQIEPLLHLIPAEGSWDAHLIFGPSLLQDGYKSADMEASIIAAYAARDPVCFNYARSGYKVAELAGISDEAVTAFGAAARYAWCGGLLANDIGNDTPSGADVTVMTASLTTIFDNLEAAGLSIGMGSTRYFKYSGSALPEDQSTGVKPYDLAIVFPFIESRIPNCWDATIDRPRYDEYLLDLYHRDLHGDYVHGSTAQYALERSAIVETWHGYLYTGSWSYISQIEQRVSGAESASTDEDEALTAYTEAAYAVIGLDAGSPRDAFQARLDAIYPTVMFFEAKRLIAVAELSTAPADKIAAQAALDAAQTAGYVDEASPNTIAEQQARIDAIVATSFDQVIQLRFGTASVPAGWNGFALGGNVTAPLTYPMIDSEGNATAIDYVLEYAAGVWNETGGPTNGSAIAEFPDPNLSTAISVSSGGDNGFNGKFTGLEAGRSYDIVAVASGVSSVGRISALEVNGVNYGDRDETDLLDNPWRVPNVVADGSGEIDIDFKRATGSQYTYPVGIVLKRHAA